MKKNLLSVLLIGVLVISLTGCGNSQNEEKNLSNSKTTEKTNDSEQKELINKEVMCTYDDVTMIKTLSVVVKDSKAVKFVNTHTYTKNLDTWCPEMKKRYGSLNDIKGTSLEVTCDENSGKTIAVETWNINEIDDFDSLSGDEIPSQLTFMNRETLEFYYDWFLEAMDTQHYTCEEK